MCASLCSCVLVCVHVCLFVFMCASLCFCVLVCVCVYYYSTCYRGEVYMIERYYYHQSVRYVSWNRTVSEVIIVGSFD